jgi:hypothetical protein
VENCCNCLRKLVDAENRFGKQRSAPGAREHLVWPASSVEVARGALVLAPGASAIIYTPCYEFCSRNSEKIRVLRGFCCNIMSRV